jgi:hypothetical protein
MRRPALIAAVALLACGGERETSAPVPPTEPGPAAEAGPTPKPAAAPPSPQLVLGRPSLPTPGSDAGKHNSNGMRELKRGRLVPAIERFSEAQALDPDNATYAYNLACAYSRHGDVAASSAQLPRALAGSFPRFARKIETDPDLAALRVSSAWPGMLEVRERLRAAWAAALASPGVFVLIGVERTTQYQYNDPPSPDFARGNVYFFQLAGRRWLPLTSTRSTEGFLIDRNHQRLYTVDWRTMHAGSEVSFISLSGAAIGSLDLATLEGRSTRLAGKLAAISIYLRDDQLETVLVEYTDQQESTALGRLVDGKIETIKELDVQVTPILDDLSDGEDGDFDPLRGFCPKRYPLPLPDRQVLQIDYSCGHAFPEPPRPDPAWPGMPEVGCAYLDAERKICPASQPGQVEMRVLKLQHRSGIVEHLLEGHRINQVDVL